MKMAYEIGSERMLAEIRELAKLALPVDAITAEKLRRAADAIMNRHQPNREDEQNGR
jgi:hypothetical protein